jgi:hypothetical protein
MSLGAKFKIMVAVAAAGLLAVAGFWISGQRSTMLSEKEQKTKNLVEIRKRPVVAVSTSP